MALELTALQRADRHRLARALRQGEPAHLRLRTTLPRDLRVDEIAPLFAAVDAASPRLRASLQAWQAPPADRLRADGLRVTAIIPCHRRPPLGLAALRQQDVSMRILIASNGEEGPVQVAGADVVRLPWRGHGATRQAALAHVTDPYVLLTVDDAIPLGEGMVRTLIEALEAGGWDAVYARQIPWPDDDRVVRERLRAWTPAGRVVVQAPQVDHVAALYRTETLRRWPLPDVPIAEDAWWSRERRVGYVPLAPVLHAHRRQPGDLYRRNRDIHAELVKMGHAPAVASLSDVIAALPSALRPALLAGPGEALNHLAELVGQWRGAHKARR